MSGRGQAQSRINILALVGQTAGLLLALAGALFLAAGTLAWPAGWAFMLLFGGFVVATTAWLWARDPALLRERMRTFQPDQPVWDKLLLVAAAALFFGWLAVMGLDAARWHWSRLPVGLQLVGALLVGAAFALVFWALRENTYLASAVRVQRERGQAVVASGPYGYVRHPMYAGVLLLVVGTALLLGSWAGLLVGALLGGVVARRAVLEERLLRERLDGYAAYMARVRYRLVPRLW